MKPFSDLNGILKNGYSLEYEWHNRGLQTVTISTHQISELLVTSGRIIACDPLIGPDTRYHFTKAVTPGRYPVILSVANFEPIGVARFACAMLRLTEAVPVRWEIANINEPDINQADDQKAYGVDAGTGCFMDLDAAEILEDLFSDGDDFEQFCDRVTSEMEDNSFGRRSLTAGWANMKVSDATEANLIAFSSGWGDGGYASFWGYDELNHLTALVTDFALFPSATAA